MENSWKNFFSKHGMEERLEVMTARVAERAAAAAEAEDEAWAAELAEEGEERSVAAVVLLAAAVVGLLAALWVLAYVAHYSLRRRQERAAVAEFKSKFAPLLPRENAI